MKVLRYPVCLAGHQAFSGAVAGELSAEYLFRNCFAGVVIVDASC